MKIAFLPLLSAAIAGVSMALQGSFNTALSKVIGLMEANFVVHVIGTATLLVMLCLGLGHGNLTRLGAVSYTHLDVYKRQVQQYTIAPMLDTPCLPWFSISFAAT